MSLDAPQLLIDSEAKDRARDLRFAHAHLFCCKKYGMYWLAELLHRFVVTVMENKEPGCRPCGAGQQRLRNSSVLVVGAGGLGCPCALHLAGSGVGTLAIVDSDTVELSNLHRQIGHSEAKVQDPSHLCAFGACTHVTPLSSYFDHKIPPRSHPMQFVFCRTPSIQQP